jgi:hypothetical protein
MTLVEQYMNAGIDKEAGVLGQRIKMRAKAILGGGKAEAERAMAVGRGGKGQIGPVTARSSQMAENFLQKGRNARMDAGLGAAAALGAAGLVGGAGMAAKKLLAKKTMGQKLISALKANRKALAIGGGAAAGLGGLAAYKKAKG